MKYNINKYNKYKVRMFFCDKCKSSYNITRDVKSKQIGGTVYNSLNELFRKFNESEPIEKTDLENLKLLDIQNDERFDKMSKKTKTILLKILTSIDSSFKESEQIQETKTNNAYFVCKSCNNYITIDEGTTVYSKNYGIITDHIDYTLRIHDPTLMYTKNYICSNKDCNTHKNPNTKEAVLQKQNTGKVIYVCKTCSYETYI